jgi:energy-coupling factor transporter ATP-binding protein EcfA2
VNVPSVELTGRPLLGTAPDSRLFVDREEELQAIEAAIAAKMNVLLLGEYGTGKTSLMRQLARRLERRDGRAVFVEGQLATTPSELLTLIRARVSPQKAVAGIPEQLGAVIGAVQALGGPYTTRRRSTGAAGESELLLDTVEALRNDLLDEKRPLAVLLDEAAADIVHAIFGRLRDEIWQLPIVWLVSGYVGDRQIYLRPPADAFFSRVVTLAPLNEETARALLRARIPRARASDRLLNAVVAASSRSPRDLIRLAADVVVGGVEPGTLASTREQRDELLESLGESALRVVSDLEAHGPASASDEAFLARLGFGRSRASQILGELERLGVVAGSVERGRGRRPRKLYGVRGAAA